jgi:CheY-like chemotaxis protein
MSKAKNKQTVEACDACFKYEQILKVVPSILYVIDKEEHLILGNDQLFRMINVERVSDISGSFYNQLKHRTQWLEARIHSLRQSDLEAMTSTEIQYDAVEPPITDSRGLTFYYEATRLPLKDLQGRVTGLIVSLLDVTARRMLETQMQVESGEKNQKKLRIRPYPLSVHRDLSKPPKFLVIEDNPLAQQATQELLLEVACEVDVAAVSEDVERLFRPGKYDVVLMDIGLEGTSGYLMAKRIRQIEGDTGYHVPIIALTGFDADVVKTDCDYYFMEGAITKPLSNEQARQIIQYYIYEMPVSIRGLKSLKYNK